MSNLTLTAEQISAFLQQNPEVVSQIFVLADNHQNDDSNSNNNDNNVISLQEQQTIYLREKNSQLENKLKELKQSIGLSHQTTVEIAKQESDLKWMEEIIQRVNGLINF